MKRNQLVFALSIVLVLILGNPAHSSAQSNTATLSGTVTPPALTKTDAIHSSAWRPALTQ